MRIKLALPIILLSATNVFAEVPQNTPFYLGISGGYGATTWNRLVADDQIAAMTLSTPIATTENGFAWGFIGGYEFIPAFALEAGYTRYPTSKITFDSMSLFTFDYNATQLTSRTDVVSLSGKFMVTIPRTSIRAFSSVGVAGVHRSDFVYSGWIIRPTFGVGLNYNLTPHVMVELVGDFTPGNGQSELNPADHYVPFTYGVFAHLAYRF